MARWLRRERSRPAVSGDLVRAFEAFRVTLHHVEEAKASLAAAAPSGRSAGLQLAESLAAFEEGLSAASGSMASWRTADLEAGWTACRAALAEAGGRAEELRLEGTPQGYEELYGTLGDIMEPLDRAFSAALGRFGELGVP